MLFNNNREKKLSRHRQQGPSYMKMWCETEFTGSEIALLINWPNSLNALNGWTNAHISSKIEFHMLCIHTDIYIPESTLWNPTLGWHIQFNFTTRATCVCVCVSKEECTTNIWTSLLNGSFYTPSKRLFFQHTRWVGSCWYTLASS